ncbi:MAG: formyltransferase family protein, partial [Cellulomonas sp.]|nr:formyltransferase family protein [Rickettsiella sp.]
MKEKEYKSNARSCWIIGEGSLTLNCAELILAQGCHVLGIISSSGHVEKWAKKNKIPYFTSLNKAYEAILLSDTFDYLFSIVNPAILKTPLLNKPRFFAINFHDSMLPRYAGMHSTSWAILNGEREHGITWHIMSEKVDAGDILKQAKVDIESDDTAINVNRKCYEIAFITFKKLLSELLTDTYKTQPQQVDRATYCGLFNKPVGNGWINWEQSAEEIEVIYRATQLGEHDNFFSTSKLVYANEAFIVDALTINPPEAINSPGTVGLCNEKEIQIATRTKLVSIKKLKTLDGMPCDLVDLYKGLNIKTGTQLFIPSESNWESFKEKSIELAKCELFWLSQWKCFKPATIPHLNHTQNMQGLEDPQVNTLTFCLSEFLKSNLSFLFPEIDTKDLFLALFLIYLYRFGNKEKLGIFLVTPDTRQHARTCQNLIANGVPLMLELNDKMDFSSVLERLQKQKALICRKKTYLRDLHARYPELHSVGKPIIAINLDDISIDKSFSYQCPLTIHIMENRIFFSLSQITCNQQLEKVFGDLPSLLETLLEGIIENPKQSIAFLPLLNPKMFRKVVEDINDTKQNYPEKTIYQLFEEQVKVNPYNICIRYQDEKINYINTNEKANQLAYFLSEETIPESRIAVFMERGIDRIIAQLAIGKAACSFVVIDIEY